VTTSRKSGSCLFLGFLSLLFPSAGAETLFLKSGERVEGTLQSYQDSTFSVIQPGGETRKISREEVTKIDIQSEAPGTPMHFLSALPKATSKYATPSQTFAVWKKAAISGDIDAMVDCYALFRKDDIKRELKRFSREQREQMRKTTAITEFTPAEPLYQGDRAALEVTWRIGLQSDSQVIQFMLDGNDWKIIQ
jgi:hypothetical protein